MTTVTELDWPAALAGAGLQRLRGPPPGAGRSGLPGPRRSLRPGRPVPLDGRHGPHRYGEGQYRCFAYPLPDLVAELRARFWPLLLPVVRDWAARLGRPAPWPDDLEDWLAACHEAGQTRPTPLLLRYGPGDWNALHRTSTATWCSRSRWSSASTPPAGTTPAASSSWWSSGPAPSPEARRSARAGPGPGVHHPRAPDPVGPRLVGGPDAPRGQHGAHRPPAHPGPGVPRRGLIRPRASPLRSPSTSSATSPPTRARASARPAARATTAAMAISAPAPGSGARRASGPARWGRRRARWARARAGAGPGATGR